MALSMLLDDVVRKNRNIPDIKCAAAKELDRILAAEAKSVKRPIYIIEGEKKALSLYASCEAQYIQAISDAVSKRESGKVTPTPFDVVGISGVWQTLSGKNELQPDLTQCIDFSERDVVVIYDNDLMTNLQVVLKKKYVLVWQKKRACIARLYIFPIEYLFLSEKTFARLEHGNLLRRYFNLFFGTGIYPLSRSALPDTEGTKSHKAQLAFLYGKLAHCIQYGIKHRIGITCA